MKRAPRRHVAVRPALLSTHHDVAVRSMSLLRNKANEVGVNSARHPARDFDVTGLYESLAADEPATA
jgi:hypothetical protein